MYISIFICVFKVNSNIKVDGIIPFNTSEPSTSCIKTDGIIPLGSCDPSFSSPSSTSFSIMRPSTNKVFDFYIINYSYV